MAVVDYRLVYRDGAATGAPVNKMIVCDLETEIAAIITGNNEADLAYAKDSQGFFIWKSTAWRRIITQFANFNTILNGDITIQKANANLILDTPGVLSKSRVAMVVGQPRLDLLVNVRYDTATATWIRDDTGGIGIILGSTPSLPINIRTVDAAGPSAYLFTVDSLGNLGASRIFERNRAYAMGEWIDVPFNAANFSSDTGTWAVGAAAYINNKYTLIGKTMHWHFYISWFSGSNLITGTPTYLYITLPLAVSSAQMGRIAYAVIPGFSGVEIIAEPAGANLRLSKYVGGTFPTGIAPGFIANLTFEIG